MELEMEMEIEMEMDEMRCFRPVIMAPSSG